MNTISVEWSHENRVFVADDLPLSVGGKGCHVPIPGLVDEGPVAFLGHEAGDLFIQAAGDSGRPVAINCNGIPLTASRWLADADELTIGTARIRCQSDNETFRLRIEEPARERSRLTPEVSAEPAPPIGAVSPVDFTPRWQTAPRRRGFRIRSRAILLTAVLLVLAGAAWYVMTARAVRVETTPEAESLKVSGGLLTPKIGGRYLLRPGDYTVTARLGGYIELSAPLEVGPQTPPVVRFTLDPLGGTISIFSRPVDGASVTIDGHEAGATPLNDIQLSAGEHTVEVHAPLHLPYRTSFRIAPGDPPVELEAELEPNWAPVTVASTPSGASVSVDRSPVGSTSLSLKLEAGDRLVELRLSGFKLSSRRIRVVAGEPVDLGILRLEPEDGLLVVVSQPSGATVTVDAVFSGSTPLELAVAPDTVHEVRVSLAGHAAVTEEISVGPGDRSEVRAVLEMLTGEVVITSRPPGAELLIDGVARGTTGQTVRLEARPHEIEVRLEDYLPFRTTITPEPGLTQAVRAELRQEGAAGLPPVITSPQGSELALVGPGRFSMGASRREPGRRANEVLREVEITRPFYLAVREVSNQEFREFKSDHRSGGFGGANLEIDHHPVVNVTWEDAARYCNWLSEKAGLPPVYIERRGSLVARSPLPQGYRLPTEAEWAWAARYPNASTAQKYAWGGSLPVPTQGGNYGDQSAEGILRSAIPGYHDGYPATAPVGSFQANALGLFNLGGNVSEWVQDIYALTPTAPGTVERDPTGPSTGPHHVIRGASWMDTAVTELRLSYRDYGNTARPDVGFRIARSAQLIGGER